MNVCNNFINRPVNSYRPLACRPMVVQTPEIGGTGQVNKNRLFLITKAATMKEHSTVDLIYTTPSWLKDAVQPSPQVFPSRVTSAGETRVIDIGLIRVVND